MRIGVVFPQAEIGGDAGAVRAYAEHVEGSGWNGPYDLHNTFHEPLVTFGYLAAVTPGVLERQRRRPRCRDKDLDGGGRLPHVDQHDGRRARDSRPAPHGIDDRV